MLLAIAGLIFVLLTPVINFGVGFIMGSVVKIVMGELFCKALFLFNINMSPNSIPYLFGLLYMISYIFQNNTNLKIRTKEN